MTTLETLEPLVLADAPEEEHLEFKEAKQQYDATKLLRYCVALANEGGGHLVLGVGQATPAGGHAGFSEPGRDHGSAFWRQRCACGWMCRS